MKLKKTLLSLSLVAAMAASSVSAFAALTDPAPVPNPAQGAAAGGAGITVQGPVGVGVTLSSRGEVDKAFSQAQYLYNNTFYFESERVIEAILAAAPGLGYAGYEIAAFTNFQTMVQNAIDRCILEEAFNDVESFMADGYYAEARDVLINDVFNLLNGLPASSLLAGGETPYNATAYTIDDWQRARNLEACIGTVAGDIVFSEERAAAFVRHMFELPDWVNLWVTRVGNRFDVYASHVLPNGQVRQLGEVDVSVDGVILLNTLGATVKGTPGEYENPF